jgi:hypothetical protein
MRRTSLRKGQIVYLIAARALHGALEDKMAKFRKLVMDEHYDIVDGRTGHWRTQGICHLKISLIGTDVQGCAAMASRWSKGDEAWPTGEENFHGQPVDIAK